MTFRAVILAAGESKRTGFQKLLAPFRGRTMIEYAIEAAQQWNPLVVAGPQVAAYLQALGVHALLNDAPQRGMAHSLAIADAAIDPTQALIVVLGDKPLATPALIARICDALGSADVAFPQHPQTGEPGHPVVFSPRARMKIASLPDGDSLRDLRGDRGLVRRAVEIEDPGAYVDIDTADSLDA